MHLDFLYTPVSWLLLSWHGLFTMTGMAADAGPTWALAIVALVITARLLLLPMFIRQVHYQRRMQTMQPKLKALREQHKDDRAELNRQMIKFQQEEGFNPLGGCLPVFVQIPVFIGLYHVLRHVSNSATLCPPNGTGTSRYLHLYTFTNAQTCSAAQAKLFGAPLAATFRDTARHVAVLGGDHTTTRLIILTTLLISAAATLATQLTTRANATVDPDGHAATVQQAMLYLLPLSVMASGLLFHFPLGVLLYWLTTNLWTLAQQASIHRFHPPTQTPEPFTRPVPPARPPIRGDCPEFS